MARCDRGRSRDRLITRQRTACHGGKGSSMIARTVSEGIVNKSKVVRRPFKTRGVPSNSASFDRKPCTLDRLYVCIHRMAILFSSSLLPHASRVAGLASLANRDGRPPSRWTLVYTSTFTEHAVILRNARETTFIYCSSFVTSFLTLSFSTDLTLIYLSKFLRKRFPTFSLSHLLFFFFPLTLARLVFKTFQGEMFPRQGDMFKYVS